MDFYVGLFKIFYHKIISDLYTSCSPELHCSTLGIHLVTLTKFALM